MKEERKNRMEERKKRKQEKRKRREKEKEFLVSLLTKVFIWDVFLKLQLSYVGILKNINN